MSGWKQGKWGWKKREVGLETLGGASAWARLTLDPMEVKYTQWLKCSKKLSIIVILKIFLLETKQTIILILVENSKTIWNVAWVQPEGWTVSLDYDTKGLKARLTLTQINRVAQENERMTVGMGEKREWWKSRSIISSGLLRGRRSDSSVWEPISSDEDEATTQMSSGTISWFRKKFLAFCVDLHWYSFLYLCLLCFFTHLFLAL